MATVEELLALPYHIELVARSDSRWQARVLELEGCVAERGSPGGTTDRYPAPAIARLATRVAGKPRRHPLGQK